MDRDPHEKPDFSETLSFKDDMEDMTDGDQSGNVRDVSDGTKALLEEKCTRCVRNEDRLRPEIVTLFHEYQPRGHLHLTPIYGAKQCQSH